MSFYMDKEQLAVLIGLAIGDGHILVKNFGSYLSIEHGHKLRFYLLYKNQLISKILLCNIIKEKISYNRGYSKTTLYRISKHHKIFKYIHSLLYKNNTKFFSKDLLELLTPHSIAIWYMDDGSHSIDKNKTTHKIRSHKIAIYTFTDDISTLNIIDFFYNKYNIKFYPIYKNLKCGKRAYLLCRTKEARKFSNLIRQYILPEFQYKILQENE